jgi:diguanylate cyclase (GGDEF)-like protein
MQQHEPPTQDLLSIAGAALFTQTHEAILVFDVQWRLVAGSPGAAQLLEQALIDHIGRDAHTLLHLDPHTDLSRLEAVNLPIGGAPHSLRLHQIRLHGSTGAFAGTLVLLSPATTPDTALVATLLRREERLHATTATIGAALDLREVLSRVVQGAIEITEASAGALPLFDRERELVLPGYIVNLLDPVRFGPHTRGSGLIWQVIDTGTTQIYNTYAEEPGALAELINQGVQAALAVPVYAGSHIIGVLTLYHCVPDRIFSRQDAESVEILARQAGTAIQNARLYQAALAESERRHTLYQASVAIGAALDLEELYSTVHRAAERLMPCEMCLIGLTDEDVTALTYVYRHDGKRRWVGGHEPIGRGFLGYVARHELSLRIADDADARMIFGDRLMPDPGEPCGSIVTTVMRAGERIVGAIAVHAKRWGAYSSTDLSALEMLAATAAIAIRNAQLFAQVQRLATTDPLTGVANRRHFYDLAHREIERAVRYAKPISIILFDVDHFKRINDTHGHFIGDQVLRTIALRCNDDLREIDTLARFGGEEFIALLPETSYQQARHVAERLRIRISQHPIETDSGPVPTTISAGVASSEGMEQAEFDALFSKADQALYIAKNAGRNQVR